MRNCSVPESMAPKYEKHIVDFCKKRDYFCVIPPLINSCFTVQVQPLIVDNSTCMHLCKMFYYSSQQQLVIKSSYLSVDKWS